MALEVVHAMTLKIEPNWRDEREEIEYYLDWEVGDPLWEPGLLVEDTTE